MSATPSISPYLKSRATSIAPADALLQARRRKTHYVFATAIDLDMAQSGRKLSQTYFPAFTLCMLETIHYPVRNRSSKAMEPGSGEPEIVGWEKTAAEQAEEVLMAYSIWGLTVPDCLIGLDPEQVAEVEEVLFGTHLVDGVQQVLRPLSLVEFVQVLKTSTMERIAKTKNNDIKLIVSQLQTQLIAASNTAFSYLTRWIDDLEVELAKAASGQPGKASLDDLDRKLYKALDRKPRGEIIDTLARNATQPVVPSYTGETKDCPFCAETIKMAAKVCRYCNRDIEPIKQVNKK